MAAVSLRAGEAEGFVAFVFDGSLAVREVVAGIRGVVFDAGGAVPVTVDEESVTGTAIAVSETVDEVAVLSLVVDATLPVVALLSAVVVSRFWQAATSETVSATAIAVLADFMMFPPFERTIISPPQPRNWLNALRAKERKASVSHFPRCVPSRCRGRTNYPLVQLQRIDNEQSLFVTPSSIFTDTSWSAPLSTLAIGWYRATILTNAIPSVQQLIAITTAAPTITNVSPNRGASTGGQTVTITGTNLSGVAVVIGGNPATVIATTTTTATFVTPPHPPQVVDVTVIGASALSDTATGSYTYVMYPPTSVVATAATTTSVLVTWTAAPGATSYVVERWDGGLWESVSPQVSGTSFLDSYALWDLAYLYSVHSVAPNGVSDRSAPDLATTVIFSDPTLVAGTTSVNKVHVTELRTAVNAVQLLAALAAPGYTDPTITPGVTIVKAAHVTELRTALDAARQALSLPAISYSDTTLTAGVTLISATNINELRNGTQ